MKNITDIEVDITEAEIQAKDKQLKKRQRNKAVERILFLRLCKKYIESGPSQEFVEKEKQRLVARVNKLDELYKTLEKPKNEKVFRKQYEEENEYKKLRSQLKTLSYIA